MIIMELERDMQTVKDQKNNRKMYRDATTNKLKEIKHIN